jgi:hypothetical protein
MLSKKDTFMKLSNLLALAAALIGGIMICAPGYAAQSADCRLQPVADSAAQLRSSQSVAVLYSENTVNTLEYLQQYRAIASRGAQGSQLDSRIRQAFIGSSDPRLAVDRLQGALKDRFATVTVYDDLDSALQAHPDVVVMLDIYNRLLTQSNSRVEAQFSATFYDATLQYIGKAEGVRVEDMTSAWLRGKAAEQIAARIDQQRTLQLDALNRFDASLDALFEARHADRVAAN